MIQKLKNTLHRTRQLGRALAFVWESAPGWTVASALIMVIEGLLPIASLYMLKRMLDTVAAAFQAPDPQASFPQVITVVLIAGGVTLLSNVAHSLGSVVSSVQGRYVADHMSDILHSKSISVDLEYYENADYYDRLHRAQEEAAYRPIMIVNGLAMVLRGGISLLGVAGLLFSFHWSIALLLLTAVLPGVFVRLSFSNLLFKMQRKYTNVERQAAYFRYMITSLDFAKELRVFGLGQVFIRQYHQFRAGLRQMRLRIDIRRTAYDIGAQVLATSVVFGSYGFIAYRVLAGTATLGDMAMFYTAFQRGQGFLQDVLGGISTLYESSLFLSNLYEFLDLKPKIVDPNAPVSLPKPLSQGIVFDRVSFSYPNSTREALCDVSIEVRPGEVIALVGENGSGKTTLVKLLCRLYDPSQGEIKIGGQNIRDFRLADLRKQIGVIFQDFAHFNLTALENIWYGDVEQPVDMQRIEGAARRAGAHETIMGLQNGYDSVLGKLFDHGEELSIGQWQKVALARAFLRDSQVIVMDEPTSAMDARAEYEVFKKFRDLLEDRTAIIISHRLATVRMADRIYVMQAGRVVENGSHDQLIALNGLYARLYSIQAEQYQVER